MSSLQPSQSDQPLIVYIDFKSPFAYLAAEQTYALADRLGLTFDWRPLSLNIQSFAGAATTNKQGKVLTTTRSASQWAAVKSAYQDARRYAALEGLVFHAPRKIWDSSLAGIGLLWLQGDPATTRRYVREIFAGFWRRQIDIEDPEVIVCLIVKSGGSAEGLRDYLSGQGRREHDQLQAALFEQGFFGVPTYVYGEKSYFGRENLPVLEWLLGGEVGAPPLPAYEHWSRVVPQVAFDKTLTVFFDFRSPDSLLALAATTHLADRLHLEINWQPLDKSLGCFFTVNQSATGRSAGHARNRMQYRRAEAVRSASLQRIKIDPKNKPWRVGLANAAVVWAQQFSSQVATRFVVSVFEAFWQGDLDLEDDGMIRAALKAAGADLEGLDDYRQQSAAADLSEITQTASVTGIVDIPAYRVRDELFIGRAHLPYIEWLVNN